MIREYQVTPEQFIEVKALMGDQSDNIPGVPSIGEKTATSLIVQYQNLENIYTHLDEGETAPREKALEEHRDLAELSLKLARICVDAPIEFSMADAKLENLYTPEAYEYMKRLSSSPSQRDSARGSGMRADRRSSLSSWKISQRRTRSLKRQKRRAHRHGASGGERLRDSSRFKL